MVYNGAPKTFKSVNALFWRNLSFDNAKAQYWEYRHYGHDPHYKGLIDNMSDHNIFWSDDPAKLVGYRTGTYSGIEEWQKSSGRDANTRVFDPQANPDKLPEWVKGIVDLSEHTYRKAAELEAMDLRVLASPGAAVLNARVVRAKTIRPVTIAKGDVRALQLDIDGKPAIALWNTQSTGRPIIRLTTGADTVMVESPWLNRKTVKTAGGAVEVPVTFMPVYVHGVAGEVKDLPADRLDVKAYNEPGEPVSGTVVVVNPTGETRKLTLTIQPLEGWTAQPAQFTGDVAAGKTLRLPVKLTCGKRAETGAYTVRMVGTLGDQPVERVTLYMVGEGAGVVAHSPGAIKVDGNLADWDGITEGPSLGAIGDAKHVLPRREDPRNVDWTGPADTSARVWASWDDKALYVAVKVVDDKVIRSDDPSAPWAADAIELFVDGRSEVMQWQTQPTEGCYQIGISPGTVGNPEPVVAVFRKTVDALQAATSLTDDGYIVEVMIPLNAKNFPAGEWTPGRVICMSVLLNDDDRAEIPGRDYSLNWGGTARNFMDTTGWIPLKMAAKE